MSNYLVFYQFVKIYCMEAKEPITPLINSLNSQAVKKGAALIFKKTRVKNVKSKVAACY